MSEGHHIRGDPSRDAGSALEGYSYQLWNSLLAWINLPDDEVLYLEVAEDFATSGPEGSEAVQVKHSAGPITLRSQSVREAIANFWDLKVRNPDDRIRFRYLTNASPTVEKGSPFESGRPGILVWDECARSGSLVPGLRDFLQADDKLPLPVRRFLAEARDEDVLEELVSVIEWDIEKEDLPALQTAVAQALTIHGDRVGVLPTNAERASGQLYLRVLSAATSHGTQSLRYYDFLKAFEEETCEFRPRNPRPMPPIVPDFSQFLDVAAPKGHYAVSEEDPRVRGALPPIPQPVAPRHDVVREIGKRLSESGLAIIVGSSGLGKTIAAGLTARSYDASPIWLNLRGLDGSSVARVFRMLPSQIRERGGRVLVVLDDPCVEPGEVKKFEQELQVLLSICRTRNGSVILTAQRELPARTRRTLGTDVKATYTLPRFTVEEISGLAILMGCVDEECAKQYALHCIVQTDRHPQLVHALLTDAASKGWPQLDIDTLSRVADSVYLERKEERVALAEILSTNQLALVYRLSIIPNRFRRDQAVAIGSIPAIGSAVQVQNPGDVFDKLVGPWVEAVSREYFRLSPILIGAADEAWAADTVKSTGRAIGYGLLSCGNLTQHEAQNILLIALRTREIPLLMNVLFGLSETAQEKWAYVARDFSWLAYFESRPGKAMFPEDARASCLFRRFQYTVAAEVDPESASKILDRWEEELPPTDSGDEPVVLRFMFLITMCTYSDVPVEISRTVNGIAELIGIADTSPLPFLDNAPIDSEGEFGDTFQGMSRFAVLFGMNLTRCRSVADLRVLLESLDAIDPGVRTRMFEAFEPPVNGAALAINEVWLREAEKEEPDWDLCLGVFEEAMECGIRWGSKRLTEVAACAAVIVHEEYLRDLDGAIDLLNRITSRIGDSVVLEVQRATALFHHGRNEEALDLWNEWLPEWPIVRGDWVPTVRNSWAKAAIAASKLNRWNEAVACFDNGRNWASTQGQLAFAIGFLVDAGFAAYKAGDIDAALKHFEEGLLKLPPQEQVADDLKFILVNKCVGHVLMWCAYETAGYSVEGFVAPTVGLCSSPIRDEDFKNLPYTPHDYLFLHLVDLETRTSRDLGLYEKYAERITTSTYPFVRSHAWGSVVYRALARGELDDFPVLASMWINAVYLARRFSEAGKTPNDSDAQDMHATDAPIETAAPTSLFAGAVLVLIARDELSPKRIGDWRQQLGTTNLSQAPDRLLLFLEYFLTAAETEVLAALTDGERELAERLAAALIISHYDDVRADDLFYGHFLLLSALTNLGQDTSSDPSAHALASIVERQWLKTIQARALLCTPRLTVPEIESACANNQITGYKKVAAVLTAAYQAVKLQLINAELEMLRKIAES